MFFFENLEDLLKGNRLKEKEETKMSRVSFRGLENAESQRFVAMADEMIRKLS